MCTGEKYGKYLVIFGAPAFVGVLSACACNWYQAAFSSFLAPLRPGYEANVIYELKRLSTQSLPREPVPKVLSLPRDSWIKIAHLKCALVLGKAWWHHQIWIYETSQHHVPETFLWPQQRLEHDQLPMQVDCMVFWLDRTNTNSDDPAKGAIMIVQPFRIGTTSTWSNHHHDNFYQFQLQDVCSCCLRTPSTTTGHILITHGWVYFQPSSNSAHHHSWRFQSWPAFNVKLIQTAPTDVIKEFSQLV